MTLYSRVNLRLKAHYIRNVRILKSLVQNVDDDCTYLIVEKQFILTLITADINTIILLRLYYIGTYNIHIL